MGKDLGERCSMIEVGSSILVSSKEVLEESVWNE